MSKQKTDWEAAGKWYDQAVGKEGHYYHQQVVIPNVLKLLELTKTPTPALLDLACGQGVLSRALPPHVAYQGVDGSPSLISSAENRNKNKNHLFLSQDICTPLTLPSQFYTHATCILALQNLQYPERALQQAARCLQAKGSFILVINHPCFRIPRQSHWGMDADKKIQYRRIDRYLSTLQIPLQVHPGKGSDSPTVWTYHYSLSMIVQFLVQAGFVIDCMEEWTSDKKSTGPCAKWEDRARTEFPLFLAIRAKKQ